MTCPTCHGSGHAPIPASLLGTGYRPPECTECGGRGVVEREAIDPYPGRSTVFAPIRCGSFHA